MRLAPIAASILALGLATAAGASAQSGMMNGSSVSTKEARCNPSNPAVMINMSNKTYMPYAQAAAMMKNGSSGKTSPQTGMSEMKSVCTSTAKSMGYKMMSGSSMSGSKM